MAPVRAHLDQGLIVVALLCKIAGFLVLVLSVVSVIIEIKEGVSSPGASAGLAGWGVWLVVSGKLIETIINTAKNTAIIMLQTQNGQERLERKVDALLRAATLSESEHAALAEVERQFPRP